MNETTTKSTEDARIVANLAVARSTAYAARYEETQASGEWLDYPSIVSIETLALCNAICRFCPYPTLERKGERMPSWLFEKIIDELAEPAGHPVPNVVLCRVNEPMLDKRYFDFCRYIAERLPGSEIYHFTNVTPLSGRNLEALLALDNTGFLKISFNDHRPDEYEATMGLSFDLAYRNARALHDRKAAGEVPFVVRMGRVGDGTVADIEFIRWVKAEFPLFEPGVNLHFDWIEGVVPGAVGTVPETGCGQWFQLHFLADGSETFCCIDTNGRHGRGNAREQNALEIYNAPYRRRLRLQRLGRCDVAVCARCTALV